MKHMPRLFNVLIVALVLALVLFVSFPTTVLAAGNGTTTGSITLTPTIENIGVICYFTNDDDNDNSAVLEYREAGGVWKTAHEMYKDTRSNVTVDKNGNTVSNPYYKTYRGSIFWLTTNTLYEVRVTFSDPDGVSGANPVTGTVTTINDNPPSAGDSYYVATNGNDSNAGTEASPFKTINKAAGVVTAGSTVYVKAGTYNEQISMSLISGAVDNYITFRPYGADAVTINGGFSLDRCNYIRIKGFTMRTSEIGVYIYNTLHPANPGQNPRGNIIEDCTIIVSGSSQSDCVRIAYGAGLTIVQRNTLTVDVSTPIGDKSSIWVWRTDGHNIYRDNIMNGRPYDGVGGGPENELGHMSDTDCYNNIILNAPDDGLQLDGDNVNTRIYNNIISGGSFCGISNCPVILGPCYVFRNLIYDQQYRDTAGNAQGFKLGDGSTGRLYLYHNTLYGIPNGGSAAFATNAGLGNIVSRNNIYYAYRYVIEFGHTADNNPPHNFDYDLLYTTDTGRFIKYPGTTYTFAQYQSYGQETHGLSANIAGEFSDAAGGDFTLKSTSRLIDKGVVLTGFNDANSPWPYSGTAPDIGVSEYNSGSSPNNPPVTTPPPVIPANGGGGVVNGGGGGGAVPGMIDLAGLVDLQGKLLVETRAISIGAEAYIILPQGTCCTDSNGNPISFISITPAEENNTMVITANQGIAITKSFDLKPDGAVFNPPVKLIFNYQQLSIPENIDEDDLCVAVWDEQQNNWIFLESHVEPDKDDIWVEVDHFSVYTVLAVPDPAKFVLSRLSVDPGEVVIGQMAAVSAVVSNTGSLSGSYDVVLRLNNIVVQTQTVTLNGGESREVSFLINLPEDGNYTLSIDDLSTGFKVNAPVIVTDTPIVTTSETVPIQNPAILKINLLSAAPPMVMQSEVVTIITIVSNIGDLPGTYPLVLKINGVREAEKSVTLKPGQIESVVFEVSKDLEGDYIADVNGNVVRFTVCKAQESESTTTSPATLVDETGSNSIGLSAGITAAALIIIGCLVFVIIKKYNVIIKRYDAIMAWIRGLRD